MEAGEHYRHLARLGRDAFLAEASPAAFVRYKTAPDPASTAGATLTLDEDERQPDPESDETVDETAPVGRHGVPRDAALEVYPIAKKPGASFPDRITLGRTSNNDLVIVEHSISRLHAYVRPVGDGWVMADAGSKNGSWLVGEKLVPRKERPLVSRMVVRLGDIDLTFYRAADLFGLLGGRT